MVEKERKGMFPPLRYPLKAPVLVPGDERHWQSNATKFCTECAKYSIHAIPHSSSDAYKDRYMLDPSLFNWDEVGENEWTLHLLLPGGVHMLHNEQFHVTYVQAPTGSQELLTTLEPVRKRRAIGHTNEQVNQPKEREDQWRRQIQDSLLPLEDANACSSEHTNNEVILHRVCPKQEQRLLFEGLLLPGDLQKLFLPNDHDSDFCQIIRLLNSDLGAQWEGLCFVFHEWNKRLFVKLGTDGSLRLCDVYAVDTLFHHLPVTQWQMVYAHQTLLHQHVFSNTLHLKQGDMFHNYHPDESEVELCQSEEYDSEELMRVYTREINKVLRTKYPFKLASYAFSGTNSRGYLCNLQGSVPMCLVLNLRSPLIRRQRATPPSSSQGNDRGEEPLSVHIFPLFVVSRNKNNFAFDRAIQFQPSMTESQCRIFENEITALLLNGWTRDTEGLFVPKIENPPTFVNMRHKLDETSRLGMHLLQYIMLRVLPLSQRHAINGIQIEMLHSELVYQRFLLQRAELVRKKISTEPILAFHGVRAENTEAVVNGITEFGFDAKHLRNAIHGGGGIYCTQYFACALQYVQHKLGLGRRNYVFVCLGLPGNSRTNGHENQLMAPDQQSWFVNDPSVHPYTYYVIEQYLLLPAFLLILD